MKSHNEFLEEVKEATSIRSRTAKHFALSEKPEVKDGD